MKTLITVDNRIWGKVKEYATVRQISLSSAIEQLLMKALRHAHGFEESKLGS